jgi:lipopolysaccharide transport system ATP-binding protein
VATPIITVDRLAKAYRIGLKDQIPDTLVGAVTGLAKAPVRKFRQLRRLNTFGQTAAGDGAETPADIVWALRDVSFEVQEGEVLGVIGRNGAGKSTLLKILSRITEPTSGRAVLRGRVSSLLEVGTGFHPELTGRDNVYMNGTILGMTKREIDAKFDEIVDFSGVEKFLDTPIKRYSSGMQVRLAFAVAAHLEPEILIVDEVLAVGDAAFQQKCMQKMEDVASTGRTILFVSHNMSAVSGLCSRAIIIDRGRASEMMSAEGAVARYFADCDENSGADGIENGLRTQEFKRSPVFQTLRITSGGVETSVIPTCGQVTFEIELADISDLPRSECAVVITDSSGRRVVVFQSRYHSGLEFRGANRVQITCDVDSLPLVPSTYFIDLVLASRGATVERVERAGKLEVVFADVFETGVLPHSGQGILILPAQWEERRGE